MSKLDSPITPTVGRIVLVRGDDVLIGEVGREVPGIITRVNDNGTIDIAPFGAGLKRPHLFHAQYDDNLSDVVEGYAWRWMPYQVQQAKESQSKVDAAAPAQVSLLEAVISQPPAQASGGFSFSAALVGLKDGSRLARSGWNGKGMWIYHVPAASYYAQTPAAKNNIGPRVDYGAYLAMKTATGEVVPWLASQTDILAEDWVLLPEAG